MREPRNLCGRLVLLSAMVLFSSPMQAAGAEAFPNRPITVILAFTSGTPVENAFRPVAAEASKLLGQPVLIESRPGANSRLGVAALKGAPGDGHLLTLAMDTVLVAQPLVDAAFQIEPGKDYIPVTFIMEFPLVLVANTASPFRDLKGLLAYAKGKPGVLNIAVVAGGSGHFLAERFRQAAGLEVTIVPYKGSPPAMIDLLAGRVDLQFAPTTAKQFIDAGKLVGIATTGSERWSVFPGLATLTEAGLPVASTAWYGIVAPPGTPAEVVAKLHHAFSSGLRNPEIRKRHEVEGMSSGNHATPEAFAEFVRSEIRVWRPIIKKSGIKME